MLLSIEENGKYRIEMGFLRLIKIAREEEKHPNEVIIILYYIRFDK